MKQKNFLVKELEDVINEKLRVLDGMKYDYGLGAVEQRHRSIVQQELASLGVSELVFANDGRRVEARMNEKGVDFWCDNVAAIIYDLKKDARVKYGGGRGTVLSIRLAFDKDLLSLTLDEARRALIRKSRADMVERLTKAREEAMSTVREMDAHLEQLNNIRI